MKFITDSFEMKQQNLSQQKMNKAILTKQTTIALLSPSPFHFKFEFKMNIYLSYGHERIIKRCCTWENNRKTEKNECEFRVKGAFIFI